MKEDTMSVIKLKPAFKDYLWGGNNLKKDFHKETDLDIVAESWELSTHKDGQSVIANGPFSGVKLGDYIEEKGKAILGTKAEKFENFPMLIKFIDAKGALSIQVHPDDEYALRVEKEYGKTEMWYIVDCEEDAFLYFGVNREITKEEFRERIENNTILEVLKAVPVHKGDVFFIEAGTIHAIGENIIICEIQQNSNSTYRVYDFGRVGADGKPRELHVDKAIDVSNLTPVESDFKPCGTLVKEDGFSHVMMGTCDYFTTYLYDVETKATVNVDEDSFVSIVVLEGEGTISCNETTETYRKGDSFFVEAGKQTVTVEGACQFIVSRL